MRILVIWVLTMLAGMVSAEGEKAGQFDYYVLSLSWSPTWCALEGEGRGSPQCDAEADFGWVMHGLWPQYHRGWPSYCRTDARQPSRALTASMEDIMGSPGLAWYQWKKHGVCSGLTPEAYFDLARRAYASVTRPAVFRKLDKPVRLPATLVEEAFLKENPGLTPDMLTITCQAGRIQEARLCLSKTLEPVPCGRDVVKDCSLKDALFDPIP
ncbi:ribonuclease T2 family protein [Tropicibacter sp. S64]|uniref:ribonuclease T2 family protein n=1 Tax=Tropicibacter sp. S64 TaxID=3415122 RepID=UPI003C7AE3A5